MRILIAEDERPLARALSKILEKNCYTVDTVFDGEDAIAYLQNGNYDAAILDVMMPLCDGFEVLQRVRAAGNLTPVLILSARSEVDDKVQGLDCGANYYLTKPFDSKELLAALRAITRRREEGDSKLCAGDLTLDRVTFELSAKGGSFRLANKEFQMMEMLMLHPKALIPTERFLEKIWGFDSDAEQSVVWVYISYLRKKLQALGSQVQIRVARNAGYSLEVGE
ncbi:MAG: response regulator transcription factor [Ruminococcaceae bacterium]|nr:response regulator transcription factor [Oscillospiraceae bacterium]